MQQTINFLIMAKKKKKGISIDEEFMVCACYRYCVGRRTGMSQGMAEYIAHNYYDKLSDARLVFTAEDIRSSICDSLRFGSTSFWYEGSVDYDDRLPFEDYVKFINKLENPEEELLEIDRVSVYRERYAHDAPKLYNVTRHERKVSSILSQYDIDCLIPWQRLAALFDKKRYKKVKLRNEKEEKEAICVETYVKETTPIEDNPGYCRAVPWKWKKVYMDVEKLLKESFDYCPYYCDEYIVNVEDYNACKEGDE